MLLVLSCACLSSLALQGVHHLELSPSLLSRQATTAEGAIVLELPQDFSAVALWSALPCRGAEVATLDAGGRPLERWTLQPQPDLSAAFGGRAGERQVSALEHFYAAHDRRLWLKLPPALFATALRGEGTLALVWVEPSPARTPPPPTRAVGKPFVYDRASWGADPPQCSSGYCSTTHIAMHHTASSSEYLSPDWAHCAANVKADQAYHMYTRGWCDIGYHYLVCPHGDIFEGRAGGDDVRGAHDGYNCGSMGVAMMGYFHAPYNQSLNAAMQQAYVDLAAWKCDQQGIDPLGSAWYAGYGGVMQTLYGHRDVSSTACPGDLAYAELPQLRLRVDQAIQGGVDLILDNVDATFSGSWQTGTASPDKYGSDYRWASTGTAPARAEWQPTIPQGGRYEIALWWPAGSNRNPSTTVAFILNGRRYFTQVNQQQGGGQWQVLGQVHLAAGSQPRIGLDNSGPGGFVVVADALRLLRL